MADAHAGSVSALTAFGRYWFLALVAAVISAIAANMFVGVKLGTVVDVLLALMLVALVVVELWFGLRGVTHLISGRISDALVWFGAMMIYLLLIFPPLMAFDAYAWLTGQTLYGGSHLYDALKEGIAGFFKPASQLIGQLMTSVLHMGSPYVSNASRAETCLEIVANGLSILVALRTLLLRREEKREAAHAH